MEQRDNATVPRQLLPAGEFDLIRLGKANDGGYLAVRGDVEQATVLLALGINDDWSFERDFLALNRVPLHAYDGTISPKIYARRVVKGLLSGRDFVQPAKALTGYGKFFQGSNTHHPKLIGRSQPDSILMREALEANTTADDRVFLKIDIEGWEYRILEDLVEYRDRVVGAVIEFHDFDLHFARVVEFVDAFTLAPAHVHANNFVGVAQSGRPLALELTLTSQAPVSGKPAPVPHRLDEPNNRNNPEIVLEFD